MLVPVLLFLVGLVCLIKGGDWFVDGASALARKFHLPELLIGATVVSIGTTLPEVMVSTLSALEGHGEIAYGNAIGSVICNAALIAAITLAVRPGRADPKTLKLPVAFFFLAAAIYCVAAYLLGSFTRLIGFIMLAVFIAYMILTVRQMKKNPQPEAGEEAEKEEDMPTWKMLLFLVLGAALIAVGAKLLVENGTKIAEALGVPESVIALTFVALGTSLPELVTAITALAKGHSDLSLGNVIGANVFNLVLVSGLSVTLAPFAVPQSATIAGYNSSLVLEIPLMILVMLILTLPALLKGKLSRAQGILLLLIYAAFCAVQFTL
ncbi:MAG: calcium/sodium antiporter [Oscillospiraceae bacterium]|nr:calcium/sodium antiporter [Oscillospiraceae bacterium]